MSFSSYSPPTPDSDFSDPWALCNLLPVGTVSLAILPEEPHTHSRQCAEDGWETFCVTDVVLERFASDEDVLFCRELQFLQAEMFINITSCVMRRSKELRLRIYLVPFDLKDGQGHLISKNDANRTKAKKFMQKLLPKVVKSRERWDGGQGDMGDLLLPPSKDPRTLSDHFSSLSSPAPVPALEWENTTKRLLDYSDDFSGFGIRSTLHKYQRRTVAAMIQRELDLKEVPDSLFIPLRTIDGKEFYFQPGTMEVFLERQLHAPWRGGILCEDLGTGKTIMILALIASTLNQLPSPEESAVEDRPVLTPISFAHFPTRKCMDARSRFFHCVRLVPPNPRIPSLQEILIHHLRTSQATTIPDSRASSGVRQYEKQKQLKRKVDDLPIGEIIRYNYPFYHYSPDDPSNREREYHPRATKKGMKRKRPKMMYLSSATLIIVPVNLLRQWEGEILKHCEGERIRVFKLTAGIGTPAARTLAGQYDIILTTSKRFIAESKFFYSADPDTTEVSQPCKCPLFPGTRIYNCTCQEDTSISPLLQVRWKRLVVDEGHASGTKLTASIQFLNRLCIERKWFVTGTPTAGLLGLSYGGDEVERNDNEYTENHSECLSSSPTSLQDHASIQTRVWTEHDRSDLNKLGHMLANYVGVPKFKANPKLFSSHIVDPLMDPSGPRPGAIEMLRRVMEGVMIRHQIHEIEAEVRLPSLKLESVLLDMDPIAVKSYNALQAIIAINAVDSQRQGQDYMFHPNNAEYLQITLKNMSQIMFWSVDSRLYFCEELVASAQSLINRALALNTSPENIELLCDAFRHLQLAASDPLWRAINMNEDVTYNVYFMDANMFNTWTRIPNTSPVPGYAGLLHADRLRSMKQIMTMRPSITESELVKAGQLLHQKDLAFIASCAPKKVANRSHSKKTSRADKGEYAVQEGIKILKLETMNNTTSRSTSDSGEELDSEDEVRLILQESENFATSRFAVSREASSLINRTVVKNSTSTKLNYIVNEVLKYSPTEKMLIFSESELSLVHISDALELIDVKYFLFTSQAAPEKRQRAVLDFQTSDTCRVFLMELKHGARGLNLTSASRVIFCEPVWQADVESQAIKRVHRIGQTRPVVVKTLAIRRTAEEKMISRRKVLKDSPEKLPKLIEEAGMRHFIANPKFIEDPPKDLPQLSFSLFNIPAKSESSVDADTGAMHTPVAGMSRARKRAKIQKDEAPSVAKEDGSPVADTGKSHSSQQSAKQQAPLPPKRKKFRPAISVVDPPPSI